MHVTYIQTVVRIVGILPFSYFWPKVISFPGLFILTMNKCVHYDVKKLGYFWVWDVVYALLSLSKILDRKQRRRRS